MEQVLIDKFTVPGGTVKEFTERMSINRNIIRKLPGFVSDAAYQRTDGNSVIYVTVATCANEESFKRARESVKTAYEKEGFDMPAMLKRLQVQFARGIYSPLGY